MNPASLLVPRPAQREAIRSATARLAEARRSAGDRGTLSFRLRTTPRGALELLLMAVLPCAALLAIKPLLMNAWHGTMLWWSERLALPLGLERTGDTAALAWLVSDTGALLPNVVTSVATATAMAGHLATLLNASFYLMLALPPLLALGWVVLRVPLHQKLLCPVLVMGYFAVMLPHQALLHAVVVQHLSAPFMPMVYLCFGAVLNLMVLVALCAWLGSLDQAPSTGNTR